MSRVERAWLGTVPRMRRERHYGDRIVCCFVERPRNAYDLLRRRRRATRRAKPSSASNRWAVLAPRVPRKNSGKLRKGFPGGEGDRLGRPATRSIVVERLKASQPRAHCNFFPRSRLTHMLNTLTESPGSGTGNSMTNRNKCLRCTRKCPRCKAVPQEQVGGWESHGWTYIGNLDDGYALIAYQQGCTEPELLEE